MTEDQYNTLMAQHLALIQQDSEMLTALIVLSVVGLLAVFAVAMLAAWSVQSANQVTLRQSEAIRAALAEIRTMVQLIAAHAAHDLEGKG